MRPNPTQPPESDSGRVIYLGEVRRRRTARNRTSPDSHYLIALGVASLVAWIVWLTVVFTLQPGRLLTYLAFFAPMFLALTGTGAMVAYAVVWRVGHFPSFRVCLRRGALGAAVIVGNLALLAAHYRVLLAVPVTVVVAVLVDVWLALRDG